jgi:hypothetical protein
MPLTTQEDYERLGEHLRAIDPLLVGFTAAHGYTYYPPESCGRYPNRRITQEGVIFRSIHIALAEGSGGQQFDRFFPEIPYTVFGGAWIDDHERRKRWHSPFLATREIPFTRLLAALPAYLDQFHHYLTRITEAHILACDCPTPLG